MAAENKLKFFLDQSIYLWLEIGKGDQNYMIGPVRLPSPHCSGLKLQPKLSHSAQAEKFLDVLGRRIEQAARKAKLDAQLLPLIGPPAIRTMLSEPGFLSALRSYSVEVGNDIQLDDHSVKLTILVKSRS